MMKRKSIFCVFLFIAFASGFQLMIPAAFGATTLKFSSYLPITHPAAKALNEWAAEVKSRSNGDIIIKIFPASQLFKITETFDAVAEGAVDLGFNGLFGERGKNPAFAVLDLPYAFASFEAVRDSCRGGLNDLLDKEANKLGVKVISTAFGDYAQPFTTKKPLRMPDDFKGARLRVFPGSLGEALRILGGASVMMPTSDIYSSLQRGVVDGHFGTLSSTKSGKYYEVEKFVTIGPFVTSPIHIIGNLKMWNRLSESHQKLMIETLNKMEDKLFEIFKDTALVTGPEELRKLGMEIHIQTPEEIAMFKKIFTPMYDMYLRDAGETGHKLLSLIKDTDANTVRAD
jgi:TRAP-type C4-dicarboxylate transport system substrate-binding protein